MLGSVAENPAPVMSNNELTGWLVQQARYVRVFFRHKKDDNCQPLRTIDEERAATLAIRESGRSVESDR